MTERSVPWIFFLPHIFDLVLNNPAAQKHQQADKTTPSKSHVSLTKGVRKGQPSRLEAKKLYPVYPSQTPQKLSTAPSMPAKSQWEPRHPRNEIILKCPQHTRWRQRKSSMVPGLSSSVASNELPPPHGVSRVHAESLDFHPQNRNKEPLSFPSERRPSGE